MLVLGIETSCDETSAAIIRDHEVVSSIVSSQEVHSQFGGVVPELASRAHIRLITPIVRKVIADAGIDASALEGLSVTYGPGLVGALLVGVNFVKGLSQALDIPFIGVNHLEGHIYGNLLSQNTFQFPVIFLIVSGGHTMIILMKDHLQYEILGKTRDDAVGEAFDKGAKMLGLGYPGGPEIDRRSKNGNPKFIKFPRAWLKGNNYDFSYSGLKTSLLTYIKNTESDIIQRRMDDICASYQAAAVDVLIGKTMNAAREFNVKQLGIAGGVAANSYLRKRLTDECAKERISVLTPEPVYCTDNAAMIARVGLEYLKRGKTSTISLNAFPSLKIKSIDQ